jgi:intracellular sulfur oxidation DsrE/DsrF family protein
MPGDIWLLTPVNANIQPQKPITNRKTMNRLFTIVLLIWSFTSAAGASAFKDGPLIKGFGKHAKVNQQLILDTKQQLKVVFDISESGKDGAVNGKINTLARFLNMHVANGFKAENIHLALVVHGGAVNDVLNNGAFQIKHSKNNPNRMLLNQLLLNNVQVFVCGQSAAYYDVSNSDLHKGVRMALSAMTAHHYLNGQGYSLNPF